MAESDTTTMNLQHSITVNGQTFQAGQNVRVPKAQADDVARMDYDYQKHLNGLVKQSTYQSEVRI